MHTQTDRERRLLNEHGSTMRLENPRAQDIWDRDKFRHRKATSPGKGHGYRGNDEAVRKGLESIDWSIGPSQETL